ncbi:Der1-like family-domain-containing protein [Mycena capillaripes]|nr:Der1-like family-domain-containing protein [Mycena capillaripes]
MNGRFLTDFRKLPPVTRTLLASTATVTLSCLAQITSPSRVVYTYSLAFQKLQIWRLYTSFFFASGGITFIFELVMLYRMMDTLESGPYARRSADLAWQLFIANILIFILSIPVERGFFFQPFILCIAYMSSALSPPGTQTSAFGLVTLPVTYLPYIMLGTDLLHGGPYALVIVLPGAVVGHMWWWSVWGTAGGGAGGVLEPWSGAPMWMKKYMGEVYPLRRANGATDANIRPGPTVVLPGRNILYPRLW